MEPISRRVAPATLIPEPSPTATPSTFSAFVPWGTAADDQSGEQTSSESAKQVLQFNEIGSSFFSTLSIAMLAGRDFVNRDADAGTCILSQAAASKLFRHSPALGSIVREYLFSLDARICMSMILLLRSCL
ncbi:hypothetical protein [Tunturiibacter gelidiferens]|uniref:hypothetical protein n=1 Tax=Tunturiibacter gelidiferens TaxID=3069689 RepID=UPI003D9AFD54